MSRTGAKLARLEDDSDGPEEEREIPVPLKRRQYLQYISCTKAKTCLDNALRQFNVLSNPFRRRYSDLPRRAYQDIGHFETEDGQP